MWLLQQLLEFWHERLGRLVALSAEPSGDQWLWRARARILRYLIARYGNGRPVGAPTPALRDKPRVTICLVEPADAPPKTRDNLGGLFRSIRRANDESRRRLRWRWI